MQDMKIEYRGGKLVELSIDGVSFSSVTAINFNHEVTKCNECERIQEIRA